jgi:prepilin-type N-terminal cleavage/methylation domain-containing protein
MKRAWGVVTRQPAVRRQSRPALRRGVSLIELLVVISIASVIIGLCVTTIHLLLRSERDQSRDVRTAAIVSRLAEVYREDVHATSQSEIVVDAEHAQLILTDPPGREIVYTADEHLLRRVERLGGALVHRDVFCFPPESRIRFAREESPRIVRVTIDVAAPIPDRMPVDQARRAPRRPLVIEAVADRDRRFAGRQP